MHYGREKQRRRKIRFCLSGTQCLNSHPPRLLPDGNIQKVELHHTYTSSWTQRTVKKKKSNSKFNIYFNCTGANTSPGQRRHSGHQGTINSEWKHKHHQIKTEDWKRTQTRLGDTELMTSKTDAIQTTPKQKCKRREKIKNKVEIQRKSERKSSKRHIYKKETGRKRDAE